MTEKTSPVILIVEDDPGVGDLERRRLQRAGYQVVLAGMIEEALAKLRQDPVDLVLLDDRLPGQGDGLEFCRRLLQEGLETPVILVTGFSAETTVIQALRAGVRDFVPKSPEYLDYLPEAVARVLSQVAMERRVKESEARLAGIIRSALDAILTTDAQGRITLINPAAERLFCLPAALAVGQPIQDLLPDLPPLPPPCPNAAETDLALAPRYELRGVTGDGREFPVEVSIAWVEILGHAGHTVVARDLTEQKNRERQQLRTQRLESIGILAGGIAHDLNNVLTPILMGLDLLPLSPREEERRALIETMRTSAERGAALVRQILSFAQGAEGEQLPMQVQPVVKETRKLLQHTLPKSIQLQVILPEDLWWIAGDATQVAQVLMNLGVNARDAMPLGGRLTIRAANVTVDEDFVRRHLEAQPGPYVLLEVSDTGFGIAPENLDKIFDPFFTTKEPGRGTGLGLSTALGIVTAHGGFIQVASEPNQGTCFSVYLPALADGDAGPGAEEVQAPVPGHGEWILVVDDEPAIRNICRTILEENGYRVLQAGEGTEAVALYAQHRGRIQVVLVDLMMPVLDGPGTIQALQRLDPQVRIIAVSGLGNLPSESGPGLGEVAFLQKPYTGEKLLRTVGQVLHSGKRGVLTS